jgi:hypothetical protein
VALDGQKNRTQKDIAPIFLRSIFLPYQVFFSFDVIGFHPVRIQAYSRTTCARMRYRIDCPFNTGRRWGHENEEPEIYSCPHFLAYSWFVKTSPIRATHAVSVPTVSHHG